MRLITARVADAILEGRGALDKEEVETAAQGAEPAPLEAELPAAAETGV